MSAMPRLLIWTSIPTHHQSAFFAALRARGFDVIVHYYQRVEADRLSLGWEQFQTLPRGEHYVAETLRALETCADWRQRIHIIPGYHRLFLIRLARYLSERRVPWIHWSEHSWPKFSSRVTFAVKRLYGGLVRRHALGALAISDLAREEFNRWGIPAERVRFLPYAVPRVPRFEAGKSAQMSMHLPRFLFLGQLCHRKRIDLLLLAMRDILEACPDARLELAGKDQSDGSYERAAERLEIAHAVRFSGVVAAARIGEVILGCDVLILPSQHDGWGVVLNEAASAGKALIASEACGAAHHLIEHGINGYRFPVGDRAALIAAMMTYCRNPGLARRHGAQSLRIFEHFTPERNAQRLEEALASLQSSTPAARHGHLA